MSEDIKYILYQFSYRESLLDLLGHMWNHSSRDCVERRFSWRYEHNYCLQENTMFIAVVDHQVVGFRGYTAQSYCFNGKRMIVLSPSDAIVHPSYRRKGVFDNLMKLSMQSLAKNRDKLSLSVFLNLSSNEKSTPAYLKLGWRKVATKDSASRISITCLVRRIMCKSTDSCSLVKSGSSIITVSRVVNASLIREINHFIKYPIEHDNSDEYYKWRYDDSGEKNCFVVYTVCGNPMAFMIVKKSSKHLGLIMDYAAESPKDLQKMMLMSLKVLGYSVLRIRIAGGTNEERMALWKCGFFTDSKIVSIAKRKNKPPVLLKCVDPDNRDYSVNGIDIINPMNWRLLAGESH